VVRQDLSQQGRVARDLFGDTAERLVIGRKDGVVALRERAEESSTFGRVGDARGDLDERVETGATIHQYLASWLIRVNKARTYVRAPSTVWRYA
jgi:hypothetical protein